MDFGRTEIHFNYKHFMSKIIQFLHPGSEHDSSSGLLWNSNDHKRKFMRINGACIDKNLIQFETFESSTDHV
jgi:hypothetical protein